MNPGFHLALTWWKPRFTSFTAGQSLMIKLNPSPCIPIRLVSPAWLTVPSRGDDY